MKEMQIIYTDGHQEHRVSLERLICELPDGRRLELLADDEGRGQWRLLLTTVPDGQDAQCLGVWAAEGFSDNRIVCSNVNGR